MTQQYIRTKTGWMAVDTATGQASRISGPPPGTPKSTIIDTRGNAVPIPSEPQSTPPGVVSESVTDQSPDLPPQDFGPGVPSGGDGPQVTGDSGPDDGPDSSDESSSRGAGSSEQTLMETGDGQYRRPGSSFTTTGDVLSVSRTTDPNKFLVRMQAVDSEDGRYLQYLMSADEVRKHGGEIPVSGSWGQEEGTRWADPDTVTESQLADAYADDPDTKPEFSDAPQEIINYHEGDSVDQAGLAGFLDADGETALYSHPSRFTNLQAAVQALDRISDPAAQEAYKEAFKAYWGVPVEGAVRDLPPGYQQQGAEDDQGTSGIPGWASDESLLLPEGFEIPTEPDEPGGQVATVNGREVYIQGSTMREVYGFDTPEQYHYAQQTGGALATPGDPSVGAGVHIGPYAAGPAAEQQLATEHGISDTEARRLMEKWWRTGGHDPEFDTLTDEQKTTLEAATTRGSPPWMISPTAIEGSVPVAVGGELYQEPVEGENRFEWKRTDINEAVLAPTPEQQIQKNQHINDAIDLLRTKGLLHNGQVSLKAFDHKGSDVRHALFEIGLAPGDIIQRQEWLADNIYNDTELRDIAEKKGIDAAYRAWDEQQQKLQQARQEFVDKYIRSDDYLNDILNTDGEAAAIAAYSDRAENQKQILDRYYTTLPDGKHIRNYELERIASENPDQYQTLMQQGYGVYKDNLQNSLAIMQKYQNDDGSYNLLEAMKDVQYVYNKEDYTLEEFERAQEIREAYKYLFPHDVIWDVGEEARNRSLLIPAKNAPEVWKSAVAEATGTLGGILSATQGTPFPHDDAIAYTALATLAGAKAAKGLWDKYVTDTGKTPDPQNMQIATPQEGGGYSIIEVADLLPEKGYIFEPEREQWIEQESLELGQPKTEPLEQVKLDKVKNELITTPLVQQDSVIILDPLTPDDRLPIMTAAATAEASAEMANRTASDTINELERYLEQHDSDTSQLDNIKQKLDGSHTLNSKYYNDINKVLDRYSDVLSKHEYAGLQQGLETSRAAHEEYLRNLDIYRDAWKQYVASLNPTPVSGGTLNDGKASAIAMERLLREYGAEGDTDITATSQDMNTAIMTSPAVKALTRTYTNTYNQSLTNGLTRAAAHTIAQQAVQDRAQSMSATGTATGIETATKAATQTAADTATETAAETATEAAVEATTTAEAARVATAVDTSKLQFPKPDASDKKKREYIRNTKGAVTWNMGKLGRDVPKDVWHVRVPPYDDDHHLVVMGKAPQGATKADGPGSAYETAQALGGNLKKPFTHKHGIFTARVSPGGPRGASISFRHRDSRGRFIKRDPKGEDLLDEEEKDSRGRITDKDSKGISSEDTPPIHDKSKWVSKPKAFRITPKRPRIKN